MNGRVATLLPVVGVLAVLAAVAGCGSVGATGAAGGDGSSPTASVSVAPTVHDCGTVKLDQGQRPDSALRCVLEASRAGTPAHLSLTMPTVEGDLITTTYAVRVDGTVEVVEDTRADAFGPRQVLRTVCPRQSGPTPELVGCPASTPVAATQ